MAWAGARPVRLAAMTLQGRVLAGCYALGAMLGAGGMAQVYRARDHKLGREVAIKVLPSNASSDPGRLHRFEQDEERQRRFVRKGFNVR